MYKAIIAKRDPGHEGGNCDHYVFGDLSTDIKGGFYVKRKTPHIKGPDELDVVINEFDEESDELEALIGTDLIEEVREND